MIDYQNNDLMIEGISCRDLVKKYGTPLYCYSAAKITENFNNYLRAFSLVTGLENVTVCYACKANSNIAVLTLLRKLGAGIDIVSGGELFRAQQAGIAAARTVYSGVGKSARELETAIKAGLMQINVESEEELEEISRIAKRLKKTAVVALRVNPDIDAKTHAKITTGRKEDKFGIDINDAPRLYKKALKLPCIDASGVAVHIGSQLTTLAPYKKAYTRVAALVEKLRQQGNTITRVDLGGGIGIRYKDETPPDLHLYALLVHDIILPLNVHVILEPGRSIVGDAGVLLTQVRHIKKTKHKNFLILDAAMNDLMRPALYDAYHGITPCAKPKGRKTTYDIVGPVCETGDTFLKDETLPVMKTGDLVAIRAAGAYGAVMSSNYNTRPLAGEVLVSGKKSALIRKPQTVAALAALDNVPDWV